MCILFIKSIQKIKPKFLILRKIRREEEKVEDIVNLFIVTSLVKTPLTFSRLAMILEIVS